MSLAVLDERKIDYELHLVVLSKILALYLRFPWHGLLRERTIKEAARLEALLAVQPPAKRPHGHRTTVEHGGRLYYRVDDARRLARAPDDRRAAGAVRAWPVDATSTPIDATVLYLWALVAPELEYPPQMLLLEEPVDVRLGQARGPGHTALLFGRPGLALGGGEIRLIGPGPSFPLGETRAALVTNKSGHIRPGSSVFNEVEQVLRHRKVPWWIFVDHAARRVRLSIPGFRS